MPNEPTPTRAAGTGPEPLLAAYYRGWKDGRKNLDPDFEKRCADLAGAGPRIELTDAQIDAAWHRMSHQVVSPYNLLDELPTHAMNYQEFVRSVRALLAPSPDANAKDGDADAE